jgi:hypothetical protein
MPTFFCSEAREARGQVLVDARRRGLASQGFWILVAVAIAIGAMLLVEFRSVLLDQARVTQQRRLEWQQASEKVARNKATPTRMSSKIVAAAPSP